MTNMNIDEMKFIGGHLTWTNGHVSGKIDRALCDARWVANHAHVVADF